MFMNYASKSCVNWFCLERKGHTHLNPMYTHEIDPFFLLIRVTIIKTPREWLETPDYYLIGCVNIGRTWFSFFTHHHWCIVVFFFQKIFSNRLLDIQTVASQLFHWPVTNSNIKLVKHSLIFIVKISVPDIIFRRLDIFVFSSLCLKVISSLLLLAISRQRQSHSNPSWYTSVLCFCFSACFSMMVTKKVAVSYNWMESLRSELVFSLCSFFQDKKSIQKRREMVTLPSVR